ncbi:hypothetical protein GALMADRAFT_146507 [Galerina marginata CBS 339.88]|uniref:Uncharacterized protein n=1 Tax=Galerina marginata (strain CBS 339.88) TaxID=685588 RepID=A0A067SE47_GALM3|nr:hypothetical protein GALMADRAFT_146507 [Galerina marginata CBS 339.88]
MTKGQKRQIGDDSGDAKSAEDVLRLPSEPASPWFPSLSAGSSTLDDADTQHHACHHQPPLPLPDPAIQSRLVPIEFQVMRARGLNAGSHMASSTKEMMMFGQPYLGTFLLSDANSLRLVRVYAQITSVFGAARSRRGVDDCEEELAAVLYPPQKIRITERVNAGGEEIEVFQRQGEPQIGESPTPPPQKKQISKLILPSDMYKDGEANIEEFESRPHNLRRSRFPNLLQHQVLPSYFVFTNTSNYNIQNLHRSPFNEDDQYFRTTRSGIVYGFKANTQLSPLFRAQSYHQSLRSSNIFDELDKPPNSASASSTASCSEDPGSTNGLLDGGRLRNMDIACILFVCTGPGPHGLKLCVRGVCHRI